jgi:outer membrane protein OmpA-like peptidoglycan-associated protein
MQSSPKCAMRATAASVLLLLAAGGARAQVVDRGDAVEVNPAALGGRVLLYPGGDYLRTVPRLLEPGQKSGPIHLHMPRKHAARAPAEESAASEPSAPEPAQQTVAAMPPAPPPPKPKPTPKAAPQPKPKAQSPAETRIPAGGGYAGGAAGLFSSMATNSSPAASPAPPAPSRQTASAAPAPAQTLPGMTKRSVILFAPKSAEPADSALEAIKFLAGDLNGAMRGPSSRIEIQAFGGKRGDKGSEARRLSLRRALAIRQVLIDDGVAAERIDVRAMGGVDDSGPADRVDVYIRA